MAMGIGRTQLQLISASLGMSVVTIDTRTLTNIANAIRMQQGSDTTFKPREMASGLLAAGRLCVTAKYKAAGIIPGYEYRMQFRTVVFRSSMPAFAEVNTNYWFYGLVAITSFVGISNLANVHEMQYMFRSCQSVTDLDFRGFDSSHLTNLFYCFAGSNALATIYADATWALPSSGLSGPQCFYNCPNLVGGNGTAWASSKTGYTYFRIDKSGSPGYLTA